MSQAPLWGVMLLLSIGVPAALRMVVNNLQLENCGAMLAKLESHYEPGYADDCSILEDQRKRGRDDKNVVLRNLWIGMQNKSRLLWRIYLVGVPLMTLVVVALFGKKFFDTQHPYWLVHLLLAWCAFFSLIALNILCVLLIINNCKLLESNIKAYSELVDAFCLQVNLIRERELGKLQKGTLPKPKAASDDGVVKGGANGGLDENTILSQQVRAHPMVQAMQKKVTQYEEYLVDMSKFTVKGELGSITNFGYACFAAGYILLLVFVYISFYEARASKNPEHIAFGFAIVFAMALTMLVIVQPLLAMAQQAQAWVKLTKSFKTEARQRVSEILSPKNDAFYLHQKYEGLQDIFTWNVLGLSMMYSTIATLISTYFAIVWASIILPAVQEYADELKTKLEVQANQTIATISNQINATRFV